MPLPDLLMLVFTSAMVLLLAALVLQFLNVRSRLGPVLWSANQGVNWSALIWLPFAALQGAQSVHHRSHRDPSIMSTYFVSAICFTIIAVFRLKPEGALCVHEGGITVGFLALRWNQIAGWAFGSGEGWQEPGKMLSLDISGSDHRVLYIWTKSPWRFCYQPRPSRPINTGVGNTPQLEAALRRYVPNVCRESSATI